MTNIKTVVFDISLVCSLLAIIFFALFFFLMTAIFTCTSGCPDKTLWDYFLNMCLIVTILTSIYTIYTQFKFDYIKIWQIVPILFTGSAVILFASYGIVFDRGDIIIYIPMVILGMVIITPVCLFYFKR